KTEEHIKVVRSEALVVLEFSSCRGIPRPEQSLTNSGMFHIPVDSFIDAFGGGSMAIIRWNRHDSSPSTTNQRRYDEVYQTSRLRSSNPYRNCETRLDQSRHLRQDAPYCSGLSHF